jgi:hypothetical protein
MTILKDFLIPKFKTDRWCEVAKPLVKESTEDTYNGTRRPDFWAQVLAYTNLAKAKAVIAQLVQDYSADLAACDLKTKMAAFTDSLTDQQYADLITWAEPLRRGESNTELHCLLYSAAKFIKTEAKEYIKAPVSYMIKYEMAKNDVSYLSAIPIVYPKLRALATLEEWRGSYE